MQTYGWNISGLIGLAVLGSGQLFAAGGMRSACTAEIKKFGCEDMSDSYAYSCLKQRKESRDKDGGFSPSCFKAYASYEKANGKSEKIESHEVERREHQL